MDKKDTGQDADIVSEEAKVEMAMSQLNEHIQQMAGIFKNFSNEELLRKPAPGRCIIHFGVS